MQEFDLMAKSNKYDFQVTQDNSSWSAQIIRRVTSKKTVVSKSQDGFPSEADAEEWGQKELENFLINISKVELRGEGFL